MKYYAFLFLMFSCSQPKVEQKSNAATIDSDSNRESLNQVRNREGADGAEEQDDDNEVASQNRNRKNIQASTSATKKKKSEAKDEDNAIEKIEITDTSEKPLDCNNFDWNEISEAREVSCFNSIDEILDSLPDNVRPFWTLIRESESAQGATVNEPRVLIYDPAGRFILGFETLQDSRSVEVAVFNFKESKWDFAGLNMEDSGVKMETELCKSCHSENPKPIWGSYVRWDGAIGARGNLNEEEVSFLEGLKNNTHKVFKALSYKNTYSVNTRLRPNHTETAENSQMLNFLLARNGGLAFSRVMMDDPKLNNNDRMKMVHQFLCYELGHSDSIALLNSYNHDFNRFFSFHKETTGRPFRMHVGFSPAEMHGGLALSEAVFKDDPTYKQMYPNLAATIENLAPVLKVTKSKDFQFGWDRFEFDFSQSKGYGRDKVAFDCP